MKTILSDDIEIRTITQETIFELQYLDEVTTKDEIISSGREQIGEIYPPDIRTIRLNESVMN